MKKIDSKIIFRSVLNGAVATLILIAIYFITVILVSGWIFTKIQFSQYWFFIVALAIGFGIQISLYSYLRSMIKDTSRKTVATTGATSTIAMISCCTHYIVNVLPVLGAVGIVTVISQYQIQFFWVGLVFNLIGIIYMSNKVYRFQKGI